MNAPLERAQLLFDQSRYDLAEAELRQILGEDPEDAMAHALLALCLCQREQFDQATQEAHSAIHSGPDLSFAHYTLAFILNQRNRQEESLTAIQEALRLDPENADYWALQAQNELELRHWPAALESAESGLSYDPSHVPCTNLRAMALVKLGRKTEAEKSIETALANDPDNSVTHANQGWVWLEQHNPSKALEHFREALRLDPTNEWARQGIVEALKAKNPIYALMLRYFLWMSKLSRQAQWGVILVGYFGVKFLRGLSKSQPDWAPLINLVFILYLVFVVLTWTAKPLFNLLLRLHRFGRLALSPEEISASNWIGLSLLLALTSFLADAFLGSGGPYLLFAFVFGFMLIPITAVFECDRGWPRNVMILYTGGMAISGLIGAVLLSLSLDKSKGSSWTGIGAGCLIGFFIAAMLSSWVANLLICAKARR